MRRDGRQGWIKSRVIWLMVGMSLFLWQTSGWLFKTVLAAPTELFFSEYVEGSGNNKALEIFNGTAAPVDLSGYTLELYVNGSSTPNQQITLSGVILSQDVFVVAHSGADSAILVVAGLVDDTITGFNGDDAIVLRKGDLVVDVIGEVRVDPGSNWGTPPASTQNQTLRRKIGVEVGDTNPGDFFDPGLEWDGFPVDSFEGLGQHEVPTPTPSPTPLPPLAVVINEVAWGGTAAGTADEWIELHNTTGQAIDLSGWVITSTNGLSLSLVGTIEANGFYLIERTDDNTISDISADLAAPFGGGLANGGDSLFLSTAGIVMDTANADGGAWPGGSGAPDYRSMERVSALVADSDGSWQGNDTVIRSGLDANGAPINGTPRQANSSGVLPPTSTPTSTLTPTPTPTPTSTSTSPAETSTPTSTSTPTATPTSIATPLPPLAVVINEVAWSGTAASSADEWFELRNTTGQAIDLTGWVITNTNGLNISLVGTIEANGFYLVERTDDNTVSDIPADLIVSFGAGLLNAGDSLFLSTGSMIIDTANSSGGAWPGGSSSPTYLSMERVDPLAPDTDTNWQSNDTIIRNGQDANGAPLNGTPRQANSSGVLPPTPTPTLTPTSLSTLTPTATPTSPAPTPVSPLAVVINEVAWGGAAASTADEWIELRNTTDQAVNLSGWVITSTGGLTIPLVGTIEANGFYLIERTDDNTVSDIPADLAISFGGILANGGDSLFLSAGGLVIDTANGDGGGWPGGSGAPAYLTMERIDPLAPDTDTNWQSNDTVIRNGQDANGAPLNGTPRQANSTGILPPTPTSTPTLTPTPTPALPTETPTPTPTSTPTPTPISLPPLAVVINEVGWSGTAASTADEWIELHNTTGQAINLNGWVITSTNGLNIPLVGIIEANDFYLIERTDDNTVRGISADLIASFGGGLANGGDSLFLSVAGVIIDTANVDGGGWPGGSGTPTYRSMERVNALGTDSDGNWQGNDTVIRNGLDANGILLNGTPGQANSSGVLPPTATSTPTPTPSPTLPTPTPTLTPTPILVSPLAVVINEVAWSGTAASTADEWIELHNTTGQAIDLSGWVITSTAGLNIPLVGTIEANGFYLIERTDDNTITDLSADLAISFGGVLANGGDSLFLTAGGRVIDTANGDGGPWPGGSGAPDYLSMERIDPLAPDTDGNWQSNGLATRNGQDADGAPLNGTPGQANSDGVPPPTPTSTLTPTLTPTPTTPTPSPTPVAPLTVVINEVAWGGTGASSADEWLELHNNGEQAIDLSGWVITSSNGLIISLTGMIEADGFYLIERSDDNTVSDIKADLATSFGGVLANGGESLFLSVAGVVIDTANGDGGAWPGGSGSPGYLSMERIDPLEADTDLNWRSNDTVTRNGQDANGMPLNGTPRQANSSGILPPTPTPTPTQPPPPPLAVVINEVAWSGTAASSADEWLELLNTTTSTLQLDGWLITSTNGLRIPLDGTVIEAEGYYLIERTDDLAVSDITADLVIGFGSGLANGGDRLFLSAGEALIDTVNLDGGSWPAGTAAPGYFSMERVGASLADAGTSWKSNDGVIRNGLDAEGQPLNGTPRQANSPPPPPPAPAAPILIGEFLYDGLTPSTEGDEFIELCNPNAEPVSLTGYKVGDEEIEGQGEGMYLLPEGLSLGPEACLTIARNGENFQARFGIPPDLQIGDLSKYTPWGRGSWSLSNGGDELLVLGPDDQVFDSVAYGEGNHEVLGLEAEMVAPAPFSLQRVWPVDTNSMRHDFVRNEPTPGSLTRLPGPPEALTPAAALPGGMYAYWGQLQAHTSYGEGAGPPYYALAQARAAGLHFYGITDEGTALSELRWQRSLSQTEAATISGQFVALRGVEWNQREQGRLTIFNEGTLLQTGQPSFDTLPEVYSWLAGKPEAIVQFNFPGSGGTLAEFSFDPAARPGIALQEIGALEDEYFNQEPAFVQSNMMGWHVAPTINHHTDEAQWGRHPETRTGIIAPALTKSSVIEALRMRRVFATEDADLALGLRLNGAWMGSIMPAGGAASLQVDWVEAEPEPVTLFLYDGNLLLARVPLDKTQGHWQTVLQPLPGHFYWVKLVQADGDRAYSAPVWIEGQAPEERLVINEILPAPIEVDWDGNGQVDHLDEWVEVFNPLGRTVGLGGWRLRDASGRVYMLPLGLSIPARGFVTLYYRQTEIGLNNGKETVDLIRPDGQVVDSFSYTSSPGYDESWCRLPDGRPEWSDDCEPSPDAPNRARRPAAPLEVSIYEAKRLTAGAWVRVEGQVTAPPGIFGARTMYIQDETAGIMIYLPRDHRLEVKLGDKLRLEGNLRFFQEEAEIAVSKRQRIDSLGPGTPLHPLPIETTMMLEPFEGMLVMLQGQAVRFQGRTTFWVDDGTDPAKVYVRPSTGIKKSFIKPGTPVTVVGIVSQYSDEAPSRVDYRLLPRFQTDLGFPESIPPRKVEKPTLLPETGY